MPAPDPLPWLAHVETSAGPSTATTYGRCARSFIAWHAETAQTGTVDTWTVREYRNHLRNRRYSPATIRLHISALRSWAAFLGLPEIDVRLPSEQQQSPRWLSAGDLGRILSALDGLERGELVSARAAACIRLLAHTGLRVSEACALERGDVTLHAKSGQVAVRSGKGDKDRVVPLSPDARRALAAWLEQRPGGESLFDIGPRSVQEALRRVSATAGVECTPHTLRHTVAKQLERVGTPITVIARILGHANINTTMRYTTASMAEMQEAVDRM